MVYQGRTTPTPQQELVSRSPRTALASSPKEITTVRFAGQVVGSASGHCDQYANVPPCLLQRGLFAQTPMTVLARLGLEVDL